MFSCISKRCLSISLSSSRAFSIYNYPFKSYNSEWSPRGVVIAPSALQQKIIESFTLAHDSIKLLIAEQDIENLSLITRPKLLQELKRFIGSVKDNNLDLELIRPSSPYTNPEHILTYDHLIGLSYTDENTSQYNINNFLDKEHFKKNLFIPKQGIFRMKITSSIVIVDILLNTNVKLNIIDPQTKTTVCGMDGGFYEKCLLQFTSKSQYKEKEMILPFSEESKQSHSKDQIDYGWKISNINGIIDESNYEHLLDYKNKDIE